MRVFTKTWAAGIFRRVANIGSMLVLALILLATSSFSCMAAEESTESSTESEYSSQDSNDTNADNAYLSEVTQWLSERVELIGNIYQDTLEDISEQRQNEKLAQQIQYVYDLMSQIREDTPWKIHVNLTTCTVTIYRVLEVDMKDMAKRQEKSDDHTAGLVIDSVTDGENGVEAGAQGDSVDGAGDSAGNDFGEIQKQTVLIPVYACPCSPGANNGTPLGTFTIQDHLRWHELMGPSWGQWCCHFAPSYLFHSLPYSNPNDPYSMPPEEYNNLGKAVSHGCVRLAAIDAKYIYDNAPTGTEILIFAGTEADDPLGTPERPSVGEWDHSYDPTDPELPENQG